MPVRGVKQMSTYNVGLVRVRTAGQWRPSCLSPFEKGGKARNIVSHKLYQVRRATLRQMFAAQIFVRLHFDQAADRALEFDAGLACAQAIDRHSG